MTSQPYFSILMDAEYVPHKKRNKEFWKLAQTTLEEMYEKNPVFVRGLMNVLHTDRVDSEIAHDEP